VLILSTCCPVEGFFSSRRLRQFDIPVFAADINLPPWGGLLNQHYKKWGDLETVLNLSRGGGAGEVAAEDDDDEEEKDGAEEEEDEEEDEYDEEDEEEEKDEGDGVQIEVKVEKYDEPLVASPFSSMMASLGVMLLARKVNLFSPTFVKFARFLYIGYLLSLQAFLLYVRFKAQALNDLRPITLTNPLSGVLQSQLGGGQNDMVKNIASSFLSSKSTIMDYDLKEARGMQRGLIFSMLFMWWLHFKMNQVQPLLIQSINGFLNLLYSPLFQVYVLGRNLERPFKGPAPALQNPEDARTTEQESTQAQSATSQEGSTTAELVTKPAVHQVDDAVDESETEASDEGEVEDSDAEEESDEQDEAEQTIAKDETEKVEEDEEMDESDDDDDE